MGAKWKRNFWTGEFERDNKREQKEPLTPTAAQPTMPESIEQSQPDLGKSIP